MLQSVNKLFEHLVDGVIGAKYHRLHCQQCGYDVRGTMRRSNRYCPECAGKLSLLQNAMIDRMLSFQTDDPLVYQEDHWDHCFGLNR